MPRKDTKDITKTFHYVPFDTFFHLELAVKAYRCSHEALLTNIVAAFWDKKKDEIEKRLSTKTYNFIQEETIRKYGGQIDDTEE